MHVLHRICALGLLCATPGWASTDMFGSPSVSRMTAAYDPDAQAVLLGDAPDHRIFDPQVEPAGVYQPQGRVYGVQDPFAVSGPGVVASPGPMATLGQPMIAPTSPYFPQPSYNACGPVDPYACQPCYPQPLATPTPIVGTSALRPAHAEIEGRAGDPAETLQGNLMVPFWQQQNVHWFFDIRGQYDDNRSGEGNFGVARRELLSNGLIVGVYSFYDLRHSQFNNNFQQGMVGFELLTLDWEYRVNGYLPFTGTQATGVNSSSVQGGNIVVQQGLERAYFGWDAEFGWLMWRLGGTYDHEVRAFAGGYYFDTDKAGFPSIGGVRARLEGRLYDLPILGAGSRFTYGASYQWDDVRDNQWLASVNLRIPFGAGGRSYSRLSPIDRRMLSAIRRDEAIVTGRALGAAEQAVISSNGIVATNVTEADTAAEINNGGPIVVVTGDISTNTTINVDANQFVGGQFEVQGQNSGAKATFGKKHTITGTDATKNVVEIANNSTLTGLNITGGNHGVFSGGLGVSGFTLSNNTVTAPAADGIHLEGTINGGTITGNTLTGAAGTGLSVSALESGIISENTASGNLVGIAVVGNMTGGAISGNTTTGNQSVGLGVVGNMTGGVISGN
ncbi:MAG: inverse autotransporter beta domain-containing protein, partial [Planctomycetales bacterium]|nr:inverse autotransporter beta domain-containing protein [Planctomycetales bacterium]